MLVSRSPSLRLSMVLALSLTMALVLGLAACDSGGSSSENPPNGGDDGIAQTFTPSTDAPDALFYVCDNHVYMGGEMQITDSSGNGG